MNISDAIRDVYGNSASDIKEHYYPNYDAVEIRFILNGEAKKFAVTGLELLQNEGDCLKDLIRTRVS